MNSVDSLKKGDILLGKFFLSNPIIEIQENIQVPVSPLCCETHYQATKGSKYSCHVAIACEDGAYCVWCESHDCWWISIESVLAISHIRLPSPLSIAAVSQLVHFFLKQISSSIGMSTEWTVRSNAFFSLSVLLIKRMRRRQQIGPSILRQTTISSTPLRTWEVWIEIRIWGLMHRLDSISNC